MRIENYSIAMQSVHTKKEEVSFGFEEQLLSLNQSEEIDDSKSAINFAKRLEYSIVQEFIHSLSMRSIEDIQKDIIYNRYSNNRPKLIDFDSLKPKRINFKEISLTKEVVEHERLDVSMDACIKTDTKDIKLDIDLSFSSTFVQKHQLTKTMFYDPLVLSFDGDVPNLDSKKFSFDIDCDGELDQISKLGEGCGFLALDKDKNGCIDDGTELFGAQSGNGFYDLRRYDDDNNGWIDENDPILDSLRIWKKTDTKDELVALGELGIGAIYLGYSEGSFDIKSSANDILGRVRSNGLFLNEDGSSGIISQIDFAKEGSKLSELIQTA
jgi:hypothetical protein